MRKEALEDEARPVHAASTLGRFSAPAHLLVRVVGLRVQLPLQLLLLRLQAADLPAELGHLKALKPPAHSSLRGRRWEKDRLQRWRKLNLKTFEYSTGELSPER